MLVALIKNKDNSFEYIDLINNKLYCVHLDDNGYSVSNIDYVKTILKKVFYNKKCIFLKKYNNYEVYYDKETKLKHFMKNDKENLKLFCLFNDFDSVLYKEIIKNDDKILNKVKRITLGVVGCSLIINIGAFIYSNSNKEEFAKIGDFNIDQAIESIYSSEDIVKMYEEGSLTYNDAISYIYDSNMDEETKALLANEELLQDVFSYYKGTPLEYSANLKFDGINIQYKTIEKKGSLGAYNQLEPNIIYISDLYTENPSVNEYNQYILNKNLYIGGETKSGIIVHEYIHLLQAEGSPWGYIEEASAELLAHEYYDSNIISYYNGIKNLKLLIEIIGPEPIMKMLFSGDDEELNNILKNNLSESESTQLIMYLQDASIIDEHYKENYEIRTLLCTLYKNMYGQDITKDENILYNLRYGNYKFDNEDPFMYEPRWYLNIHKINENEEYPIFDLDLNQLLKDGIISKEEISLYRKDISLDEYNKIKQNNDNLTNIGFEIIDNNGYIINDDITNEKKYIDENGNEYSIEDATNKGYILINISKNVETGSNQAQKLEKEGWIEINETIEYYSQFSTIDATSPEVLVISSESIGSRNIFSNQIENMNERLNLNKASKKHNI